VRGSGGGRAGSPATEPGTRRPTTLDLSPEETLEVLYRLRERFGQRAEEDDGARTILEAVDSLIAEREAEDVES